MQKQLRSIHERLSPCNTGGWEQQSREKMKDAAGDLGRGSGERNKADKGQGEREGKNKGRG